MSDINLPRPTDAELAILRTLWQSGPLTVRQIQQMLSLQRHTGYTTVLKLLQIMTEKGLVSRDQSQRTHVYHPKLTQTQTQRQLLDNLMQKAFGGSASQLVLQALSAKPSSPDELAQIRQLLDELEGGSQ